MKSQDNATRESYVKNQADSDGIKGDHGVVGGVCDLDLTCLDLLLVEDHPHHLRARAHTDALRQRLEGHGMYGYKIDELLVNPAAVDEALFRWDARSSEQKRQIKSTPAWICWYVSTAATGTRPRLHQEKRGDRGDPSPYAAYFQRF